MCELDLSVLFRPAHVDCVRYRSVEFVCLIPARVATCKDRLCIYTTQPAKGSPLQGVSAYSLALCKGNISMSAKPKPKNSCHWPGTINSMSPLRFPHCYFPYADCIHSKKIKIQAELDTLSSTKDLTCKTQSQQNP